jgi:ABC-type oligopeptide transport system substrate-binding subunit
MSKKSKLILATALFGAALFGASCGGGGGTASTPPPPPPPPPPASDVAKVLVLAAKGITSPGATVGLFEGTIKSNGTVSWSPDRHPGENLLDYYHEFSDKSVLLYDINDRSVHPTQGAPSIQLPRVLVLVEP